MQKESKLNSLIEDVNFEFERELEEETTSGDAAGYDTPNAFGDGRDKDKKKTKDVATQAGYDIVESSNKISFSSQNLITKLTPKIKQSVEQLKKKYPTANIDIVPNRYESDNTYTLSISYNGDSATIKQIKIDINKLDKSFNESIKEAKKPDADDIVDEGYRVVTVNKDGEKFKSKLFKTKKEADDHHWKLAKGNRFKSVDVIPESKKPIKRENRWLALKNDESMHPNQKLAVGLKELKYQLREVETFLGWYGKIKNINELDSDTYWKRTTNNIRGIKERIINIARKLQEIEK